MVLIALGYSSNKQVLKLEKWLKMLLLHSCVWMKGSISCCCCLLVKAPLKSRTKAAELLTETWLYSIVYYFHNYGPHYHLVWIPDPHRYQQNSCTELMTLVQFHSFHVRNHARDDGNTLHSVAKSQKKSLLKFLFSAKKILWISFHLFWKNISQHLQKNSNEFLKLQKEFSFRLRITFSRPK